MQLHGNNRKVPLPGQEYGEEGAGGEVELEIKANFSLSGLNW